MKASNRDRQLEKWMDEFGGVVLEAARHILKNTQDAQDVFQNTFVKAYLKKGCFNEKEHVKAWLLRVAKNESISKLRSGWKKRVTLCEIPKEISENTQANELVLDCVKKLPAKYRQSVWLYYWAGYKTEEIAEVMQTTPATVRTRLKRAREQLKISIQRSDENE